MNRHEFENLAEGDIISHKHSADAMMVHRNERTLNGNRYVTVVRVQIASQAHEWDLQSKAEHGT